MRERLELSDGGVAVRWLAIHPPHHSLRCYALPLIPCKRKGSLPAKEVSPFCPSVDGAPLSDRGSEVTKPALFSGSHGLPGSHVLLGEIRYFQDR